MPTPTDSRYEKLRTAILDYDNEDIITFFKMVRSLHRLREPTEEDIDRIFDFVYDQKRSKLQ